MPHLKDSRTTPGSDEAFYRMMNPSLWNCQGYNYEATILTEALASTTQPRAEKKSNYGKIIRLEIALSSILIVAALLVGIDSQPDTVENFIDIKQIEEKKSPKLMDNFSEDDLIVKFKVSFD